MGKIPVFYSEKMVADSGSVSPSAAKPAKVVESWRKQFPIEIIEPDPVSEIDLHRAHDHEYVRAILACERNNGFGNRSPSVAASLRYTNGSMLSAARYVARAGGTAAAPCAGFHHAAHYGWEGFGHFCTFNGLMVTALALLDDGLNRVGILDFDMHIGNGTADIVKKLDLVSRGRIRHYTAGALFTQPSQAEGFLSILRNIVAQFESCDIVLYQAGADPHINDPFGGWLTTEQLRTRDSEVFEMLRAMHMPVVWNLAGGYQVEADGSIPKVLEIHDNTMRECVRVFGGE